MSLLALAVIAISIVVLLKVGRLLFDPPTRKRLTLSELEDEMMHIAHEWARSAETGGTAEAAREEVNR